VKYPESEEISGEESSRKRHSAAAAASKWRLSNNLINVSEIMAYQWQWKSSISLAASAIENENGVSAQ
jgi:hypothetical protein